MDKLLALIDAGWTVKLSTEMTMNGHPGPLVITAIKGGRSTITERALPHPDHPRVGGLEMLLTVVSEQAK